MSCLILIIAIMTRQDPGDSNQKVRQVLKFQLNNDNIIILAWFFTGRKINLCNAVIYRTDLVKRIK